MNKEVKKSLKFYTLDLLFIILILNLIIYTWNTLFFKMINIAEIGTKEAGIIMIIMYLYNDLFFYFRTSDKKFNKTIVKKNGSKYRSKDRNIMIFVSIGMTFLVLYIINNFLL